jgi:hypothetical protein
VRFLAHYKPFRPVRLQQEPHVVVIMPRFRAALGNLVNIHIERSLLQYLKPNQPRFLASFSQRHSAQIRVAVRMPAHLQPTVQFPMVRQQNMRPIHIDHPGASRHMPGRQRPLAAVLMCGGELKHARQHFAFSHILGSISL